MIEEFLCEQYIKSDSKELDMWIAYLAVEADIDWLAEVIYDSLER